MIPKIRESLLFNSLPHTHVCTRVNYAVLTVGVDREGFRRIRNFGCSGDAGDSVSVKIKQVVNHS